MDTIASQITSLAIVYPTVYSDADQSKHQSSAPLAFVWGIHRRPVNSPYKWPVTRKMFPFDDVIIFIVLVTLIIAISLCAYIYQFNHSTNSTIVSIIAFLLLTFFVGMPKYSGRDSNSRLWNTTGTVGSVVQYQPLYSKVGQFGQVYELNWQWGLNEMADTLQMTYWNAFPGM